jgi:hypothetical protein
LLDCRVGGGGEDGRAVIALRAGSVELSTEPWARPCLEDLDFGVSVVMVVTVVTESGLDADLVTCWVGVRRPFDSGLSPSLETSLARVTGDCVTAL